MTDSRVTPQAVEAAAAAIWDAPADATDYVIAGAALAAAVPLLCQPLQDEIDRLTQQNEQLAGRISHLRELCGIDKFSSVEGFAPEVERLRAVVEAVEHLMEKRRGLDSALELALAAVPVGTGNPTQPRADD